MKTGPIIAATLAASWLSGCQTALPPVAPPAEVVARSAPPGAAPGTCWGQDETPAVIETVTEQVILQPAQVMDDGTVASPAVYKTETHQKIVKPRQTTWFETPCEDQLTPEFNASLQRALKARGHYRGPVNGQMDARTRAAIRAYQKPQGLDSGMISLAAARQMGLVAVETPGAAPTLADATAPELTVSQSAAEAERARQARQAAREAAEAAEAERLARAEQARREAQDARREAEEAAAREAERTARAEAERAARAEAERAARARAEAEQHQAELAAKEDARRAAQAEHARRQAELEAALEAERAAKTAKSKPLPISAETY